MSPTVAFALSTWVAIVVLFLGLGAVLRELRLLRGGEGFAAERPDLSLGRSFPTAMVVAADTGCGLCVAVVRRLALAGAQAAVLTHEPAEAWADLAGDLPLITDRESWRAVGHLSPPVLLRVDAAGRVLDLTLPVREEQAEQVAAEWGALAAPERTPDAADR
jgi:hypothetical protein